MGHGIFKTFASSLINLAENIHSEDTKGGGINSVYQKVIAIHKNKLNSLRAYQSIGLILRNSMLCLFFFLTFGIIFFNFGVYAHVVKIGGNSTGCTVDKFFFCVFFLIFENTSSTLFQT